MSQTAIIYGSTCGFTELVAKLIQGELKLNSSSLFDVAEINVDIFKEHKVLILGTSTWDSGDLQDDWFDFLPTLDEIDFSDKTVALFGVGDAQNYPANFADAVGKLFDELSSRGARIVGSWPTAGYNYVDSEAERDGSFVGLVLDLAEDPGEVEDKVEQWVGRIRPYVV